MGSIPITRSFYCCGSLDFQRASAFYILERSALRQKAALWGCCGGQKKDGQKEHVHGCKVRQVFSLETRKIPGYIFVGDQAGHGRDQCSQASQICADEEGGTLIGEAGQQESRRDIADDLADRHGTKEFIAGDQLLEQTADPGDLFHVPNENEKARKGDQKGVIDL